MRLTEEQRERLTLRVADVVDSLIDGIWNVSGIAWWDEDVRTKERLVREQLEHDLTESLERLYIPDEEDTDVQ